MGKRGKPSPPCCKKYGLPLYCASWIPLQKIKEKQQQEEPKEEQGNKVVSEQLSAEELEYLVLGGGGGEGRSGLKNALLLTQFNFSSRSLLDHFVNKLETGGDLPYRMAVHPGGEGLICSFPTCSRWFEWDVSDSMEAQKLALKSSEQTMTQLEDVGLQLALTFNTEGSLLATGGEDGHLRVFKWPSMEVILDQADAHASVKDLDFSLDGKYLISLGNSGPCRVWDLTSLTAVASLTRENGEVFGFCRFSRRTDSNQILYLTSMQGQQGGVVSWNTTSWNRVGSKKLVRDPISAFDVSADGNLLAIGTIEGDIAIIDSTNMQVKTMVKAAHLGLVTALTFSHDCRAVASTSFDSSARVTIIEDKKKNGLNMWVMIFVIILAIVAYVLKEKGLFSDVYTELKGWAS
ncbi:hypothetical protein MRB53_004536 [Persea americana]|uniref:Uncharacterized protein n=1 Tax=Persea americana TaxID=3435 RepID=A0ACC2MB16_PERAE|nr:hypothetical protein MRB53_004536 [Persea americana]|eukprot:TRINITY_DN3537_c0_g1_i1.p1 TRINITY_DN3537_c0_g1~~TRINITY_DN3537_c0_g1_i1.p1  ORF type:complete len:405 (-),score=99.12 TRINITY_DN3537_c0_g1_i1:337-1551(-)